MAEAEAKKSEFTCVCGFVGKNKRALHAHKLTCREARPCDCKDGGSWALLDRTNKDHAVWMQQVNPKTGKKYRKYCKKCLEVI